MNTIEMYQNNKFVKLQNMFVTSG